MDRESWWSKEHLPQYETLIGCHPVNTDLWLEDKWQMAPSGLLGHEYFNKMILLPRLLVPTTNYFERWEIVLYLYTKHINHCTNLHGSITKIMNNSNVQSMTHLPIMLLFVINHDLWLQQLRSVTDVEQRVTAVETPDETDDTRYKVVTIDPWYGHQLSDGLQIVNISWLYLQD